MAERKITGTHIVFALVVCVLIALLFVPIGPKPKPKVAKGELPAASAVAVVTDDSIQVPSSLQERYKAISNAVNIERVKETVYTLGSYESRMVGYEGNEKAAQYVKDQFEKIGLQNVKSEGFKVTVPIDQGSSITVNGQTFPIYSIWPNLVRTSQVAPEGLKCHLIDAGKGKLPDFDGKKVNGSAAIVDFNSGTEWLNAPRLGAKALLFVEPERTMRGEGEAKFSAIPVSMPRFWVKKQDAEKLKSFVAEGKADDAVIKCRMPWEKVDAENIVGFIEGTDPKLKDEIIVIHSHYDATSIVPALAPGAEGSCGIAGLLELARIFKQPEFAPRRTVMFIATSAHYQGLAGMRNFIESHIEDYRQPSTREKISAFVGKYFPENQNHTSKALIPTMIVFLIIIAIANYIRKKLSNAINKHKWLWVFPGIFAIAAVVAGYITFSQLSNGVSYKLPNPPKFYVWSGLDLSSQSEGVGIFYKGYFYDYREDIQGKFSDLAGRSRENAERVAYTLGFADQKDIRFADGVNPVRKNWRNFVPGKFALDSEVVTLAGGRGISFVTTDDGRHLLDTPLDTVEKINF
ncbi:MAG: M28 family peptidase, partial [Armatimonadota bacterium]